MDSTENVRRSPVSEPPSILSKAFGVLRAFDSVNRVMTLSEIARASGLPKSTVHRLLARLLELDVVELHGDSGYKIGLGLLQIGAVSPAISMRDKAMPYLHSLSRWTRCEVQLAVLRQFDVVFLEVLEGPVTLAPPIVVGERAPAHCAAVGKALLAHEDLDDLAVFLPPRLAVLTPGTHHSAQMLVPELRLIRKDGIARETDEYRPGVSAVGAPVVVNGYAVGAIAAAYPSNASAQPTISRAVRETAAVLARFLRDGLTPEGLRWFPGPTQHLPEPITPADD